MTKQQSDDVRRRVEERIRRAETTGFQKTCGYRTVEYGGGRARVELLVTPEVQNLNGTAHGGVIASLIDHAGTVAILSVDLEGRAGVSTDLNVTYLRPGPAGATLVAEATVLKAGKTLAYVTVDVKGPDGALVAQGRMTKYQG